MAVAAVPESSAAGSEEDTLYIAVVRERCWSLWAEDQTHWAAVDPYWRIEIDHSLVGQGGHCCCRLDRSSSWRTSPTARERKRIERFDQGDE